MTRSAQTVDLNVIENVWHAIKLKLQKTDEIKTQRVGPLMQRARFGGRC